MKLESLSLENYMGWAKIDVDLSQYSGIVAILGSIEADMSHSNGTGKSSLIAAINYALYGSTPKDCPNMDGMIRQGAEETGYKVTLRFSHENKQYEILRKKKLGSTQKTTFKNLTDKLPVAATPEDFLRVPEIVWQNTLFSAQRNLSAFVDKTPSTRKDILTEIFGMNNYLDLENKARKAVTGSETDLIVAQGKLDRLLKEFEGATGTPEELAALTQQIAAEEQAIDQVNQEFIKAEVALAELKDKAAAITKIADEISRAEVNLKNAQQKKINFENRWQHAAANAEMAIEELEAQTATPPDPKIVENLKASIQAAEQARAQWDDLNRKFLAMRSEETNEMAEQRHHFGNATAVSRKLESLPVGKCPTCGTDMTEEHLNRHKAELQAEIDASNQAAAKCGENLKQLSINLQNIRGEMTQVSTVVNSISALSKQLIEEQKKHSDFSAIAEKIKYLRDQNQQNTAAAEAAIPELEAEVKACEDDLAQKRQSMPVAEDITQQETDLSKRKCTLEAQLANREQQLDTLRDQRSRVKMSIERRTAVSEELKAVAAEHVAAKLKRDTYTELVRAFGPTGIPTLILENCLSELQQYLDHYMDILSDGKIHVTFQTVKTNATTAKTSETLTIMVSDISGERDIALYSGGETVRIYLAIRLALAKLLYLKSGQKLGLMIIDEIADLDDAGLLAFVELLKRIEPEFEQILLVSHLPELKNAFDNALVLSRDLEGNYVKA